MRMHQLIWRLFPDDSDGNRTFLFRQEFEKEQLKFESTRRGLPIFYVVSEKVPVPIDGNSKFIRKTILQKSLLELNWFLK